MVQGLRQESVGPRLEGLVSGVQYRHRYHRDVQVLSDEAAKLGPAPPEIKRSITARRTGSRSEQRERLLSM